MNKHTPGPWVYREWHPEWSDAVRYAICQSDGAPHAPGFSDVAETAAGEHIDVQLANARLIAAAPDQHAEMVRYLPILERAEADPELWSRLTAGLGIATLNGFRAAIAKAEGKS